MFSKLQPHPHHHPHLPFSPHFQLSRESEEDDTRSTGAAATASTPPPSKQHQHSNKRNEPTVSSGGTDGATIEVVRLRRGRPPGSKNRPKPPVFITRETGSAMRGSTSQRSLFGSISSEKVQDNYDKYWSFFRRPKEIETAEKIPDFVGTFYNLVTDIYEWGWGQSFHFSPSVPGKSHRDATRLHEEMAVDLISSSRWNKQFCRDPSSNFLN